MRRIVLAELLAVVAALHTASGSDIRLNNLVTKLLRLGAVPVSAASSIQLRNPRDGWVYFSFRADAREGDKVELVLDRQGVRLSLIEITSKQGPNAETMRLWPVDAHVLRVQGMCAKTAGPVIVRVMPETHFVRYPGQTRFPELGNFTWDWLKQNVLSSVNTIGGASQGIDREIDEWTQSGRKFIAYGGLPHDKDLTGARALDFWLKNPGFQAPRLSGLIADEFSGRQNPRYPA